MTMAAVLSRRASASPSRTAVVDDHRRLTYRELDADVDRIAGGLAARGVGPGDVVTSKLANCVEALALTFAVNRLGGVHNPIVPTYGDREVGFIRRQAGTAVFVEGRDDDLFIDPTPRSALPAIDHGGDDEVRFLVYTSGSVAEPKGVRHSDRTLTAEIAAQAAYHRLGARDVFLIPSPVGHVSGLLYGVLLPVWLGATSVLMGRWDPGRFLALVETEGATFSGGAPSFLQGAVEHPDLDRYDISSLALFPSGGADVPPELMRRVLALGIRTGRGYGSTEHPSITSSAGPGEPVDRRVLTDGRPIGDNEIRIVDGEIQARGPELFLGYQDRALDDDAFTADGWFRTGDLGWVDPDGYLTVTGRLKDVIIRKGEKISAREVEAVLAAHPKVEAVAVVARPDDRSGEQVCACVVPQVSGDPPTLAELASFVVEAGLSDRKRPEQVEVLAELPMTASGKVDKSALRHRHRSPSPDAMP